MSPAIVDHITFQLQTRIVQEFQRLTRPRTGPTNPNGLQPISQADRESLLAGLPLAQFGGRSVCAILDFSISEDRDKGSEEKNSTKTDPTPPPSYRDLPLLYPPSASSSTSTAPIAVFKVEHLFPLDMYEAIKLALQTYLATDGLPHVVSVTLCLSEGSESENSLLEPLEAKHHQDVTRLFIALWRLRLWFGYGWTVPNNRADHKVPGGEEEQSRGCILQGFKSVQGVFHTKWP
jgi:hypothetical protein